jgi:hypothetical protein
MFSVSGQRARGWVCLSLGWGLGGYVRGLLLMAFTVRGLGYLGVSGVPGNAGLWETARNGSSAVGGGCMGSGWTVPA